MRDIKFRAWDKKKKIWIPGAYGFHILGESMLIGGLFQDYKLLDLNNIILMQFTGIKDKNGKEIYEGDIVEYEDCMRKFGKTKVRFYQYSWEPFAHMSKTHMPIKYEIIGNIHENSELLE